jgi:hypothetical protein
LVTLRIPKTLLFYILVTLRIPKTLLLIIFSLVLSHGTKRHQASFSASWSWVLWF